MKNPMMMMMMLRARPCSAVGRTPDSSVRGPGFDTRSLSADSRGTAVSYWRNTMLWTRVLLLKVETTFSEYLGELLFF